MGSRRARRWASESGLGPPRPPRPGQRTSSGRLKAYYRLVWEDEESRRPVPPEAYSDAEEGEGAARGPTEGEEELATKMLQVQSKRFYLDVKQNWRGRFLKLAEVGAGGRKSRLLMSMAAAAEFREHLADFAEFYAALGPPNPAEIPEDGQLKCAVMVKENRRYYLDLKENNRGRFLRVTQTVARGPGGPRAQVALPAQGIVELRDALSELLEAFGTADDGVGSELPEGRQLRAENKMFYFDVGQNNRGVFMRVSEVKNSFRTAITIPEGSWAKFREIFAELCEEMEAGGGGGDGSGPSFQEVEVEGDAEVQEEEEEEEEGTTPAPEEQPKEPTE